jgi:hypothetical protein
MFFSSTHSPSRYPSVTANTDDLSFFLDWLHQHGSKLRTKLERGLENTCLTKSGFYDLRGEIVTKET